MRLDTEFLMRPGVVDAQYIILPDLAYGRVLHFLYFDIEKIGNILERIADFMVVIPDPTAPAAPAAPAA
jgi:hypothetical protein